MRIIDTSAASETAEVHIVDDYKYDYRPVGVSISASATVSIQGRLQDDMDWVELHNFTSSGMEMVGVAKFIRAVVTGNTGTVKANIAVERKR